MLPEVDITVIIPSYRSAATLRRCLVSIVKQVTTHSYCVMVVHSGPEQVDETLIGSSPLVHFHIELDRWLPGRARNWALGVARSPWVLFLDSDCIARPDLLQTMMSTAAKFSAGAVGGSILNGCGANVFSWAMHLLEFGEWLPLGQPRHCLNFASFSALYEKRLVLESGGFPENIFPCEDMVFNYRLRSTGVDLMFDPRSPVLHVRERTLASLTRYSYDFGVTYGWACRRYDLPGKFMTEWPWALLVPTVIIGRLARILIRLLGGSLRYAIAFFATSPFLLCGQIAWTLGFLKGR